MGKCPINSSVLETGFSGLVLPAEDGLSGIQSGACEVNRSRDGRGFLPVRDHVEEPGATHFQCVGFDLCLEIVPPGRFQPDSDKPGVTEFINGMSTVVTLGDLEANVRYLDS